MRGCRALLAGSLLALIVIASACADRAPAEVQVERSTDDLLVAIGGALASGDAIEAQRLAKLVEPREKTPRQEQMLRLLTAGSGGATPAPVVGAPSAPASDAWGASLIRIRRTVLDGQIDAAGYDALPFFHGYREAAACCQYALFDLGELTVTPTDEPQRAETRQPDADRVIVFDFGEFLRRAGVDPRRKVYEGETRVVDGRLLHRYEDVTGGALVGVTEHVGDAVRTTLTRHAE